jgi:pantothenate kinase
VSRGSDPGREEQHLVAGVSELVERARALVAKEKRAVLGITGPPGAGKSTLCQALLAEFGACATVVGMDGFHLANEELTRLGRRERKGAPDTFDVDGYVALLERIRSQAQGSLVYAPLFHRDLEIAVAGSTPVSPEATLVITEGNYLLLDEGGWGRVRSQLSEAWYLDLPTTERQRRLVRRRQSFGEAPEEAEQWVSSVDEVNARTVESSRARADLVVRLVADQEAASRAAGVGRLKGSSAAP